MKAFTLIEVLVGIFLILIVFLGIFGAFQLGLKVVWQSQARITAISLANQKIEEIRNLSYDGVGTIGGIPSGNIPAEEQIELNNIAYNLKTVVVFIDDPLDGQVPEDPLPRDYKRVKVKVSWSGFFAGEISLITDVAPKGIETEEGGGTVFIRVLDASGLGVAQASLHIINEKVSPGIDVLYLTDDQGQFVIAGAPASTESYWIEVSKTGFSTDRTYSKSEVAESLKPLASVFEGQMTEISFSIDKLAQMTVEARGTKGQGYPPVHNTPFILRGAKLIGQDSQGAPVYKYSRIHTTNGKAEVAIPNLEWDSYSFFVDKLVTGLDLIAVESPPGNEVSQPVDLLPDSPIIVRLVLAAENTLLITVKDSQTTEPIFGASVRVYNSDLGYDQTQPTDQGGQSFFIPLEQATYNLEIQAQDYQTYMGSVSVSGGTATTINLIPVP